MDKREKLDLLKREMEALDLPLKGEANLVFGEGNLDCSVMFVGEAPGFNENEQKRPFVGRAGKLLDSLIQDIGWRRGDVYITNIVKRRPPENRDPLPEEIESYKPHLARQIEIINPRVIAPLGRFAMNYFLPFAKISQDHGRIFEADGVIIFPLYHPAAALRATTILNDLKNDFRKLPEILSNNLTEKKTPVLSNAFKPPAQTTPPPQKGLFE